jgi:hypothetical protein
VPVLHEEKNFYSRGLQYWSFSESKLTGRNTAVLLSRVSYSNNKNYNYADGFTLPMGR